MKSLPFAIMSILLSVVYHHYSVAQSYLSDTHYDTTAFTDVNANLIGVTRSTVNWGDYDNDGYLDILLMGLNAAGCTTMVYRNNLGSFTDIQEQLIGVQSMEANAWGDYDNDGDLDIVITGENELGGGVIVSKIYRNDNGSFVDIHAPIMNLAGGSTSWGDYDNDGDLDLLICGSSDHGHTFYTKVYRNDDGSFVDIDANLSGVWGSSLAWGDYDNDGDLDIALSGYGTESVTSKIYRNNKGIFSDIHAGLTRVNTGALAWGDYDNDGDLDLLFSGWIEGGGGPFTTIYRNDNGSFIDTNPNLVNIYQSSVAWGDYDSDGDLDILMTGLTSSGGDPITKVYRNDGGGLFTDIGEDLVDVYLSSVKWGDYDNDGDLDILLTGESAPNTFIAKIYRNNLGSNIFTSNTPPTPPSNLTSSIHQNGLLLKWNKSTDNQTPLDGLSYNVRIGTTPGGMDVVSPMAGVSDGFRRIVHIGNTNLKNSWIIKNLPGGKYYWSVQSIDGAYAGSQFAEEGTFNVNVYPFTPTTSQIWMEVSDDQSGLTYPMMFGNHINATIGRDSLSPTVMEKEAPPCPPSLCANWQSPRGGHPWGVGLLRYDFRGIPTNETMVDTFVLYAKNAAESSADIKIRWPVSSYLGQRCDSMFMGEKDDKIPRVNMFLVDSLIIPDAGVQGISELYIYKYGVAIIDSLGYMLDRVISGVKFHDRNHNGIKELYEPGIANWRIDLSGKTSGSTYTDNNGFYSFTHVDTGSYTVTEEIKDEWLATVPVGGSYTVYMGLDDIALNLPFGNFNLGKISGEVFNDVNGNRGKDAGEGPVSGCKIRLSGTKVDSTLSDEAGHYEFKNLLWGSYVISEAVQQGWITTYPIQGSYPVNITYGGQIVIDRDFGSYAGGCMTVFRGWNIVSLPVKAENALKSDLFPSAISDAYKYNGTYIVCDTLKNGIGYWLKFPESQRICIPGTPNLEDSVQLTEGWNLIGSISFLLDFLAVQTVPSDLIISPLWEYNQSYNRSDTITPGQGYWVKANQAGQLILTSSATIMAKNRIKIVLGNEMPPPPPGEFVSAVQEIPKEYALGQAYPNPFNPITTIRYEIPKGSLVVLKVFNVLGQEIKTLIDEYQDPGYKEVIFDATTLPSGIYFYRLQAGDYSDIKKIQLIK